MCAVFNFYTKILNIKYPPKLNKLMKKNVSQTQVAICNIESQWLIEVLVHLVLHERTVNKRA
jgi:hypothetical protein